MPADDVDRIDRERREADARYNEALTALDRVVVGAGKRELVREDFDQLATALIVFLQQITGFVEASDRKVSYDLSARLDRLDERLAALDELSARMGIVQRALEALRRELAVRQSPSTRAQETGGSSSPSPALAAVTDHSAVYLAFEDQFRGSGDSVHARVREHVPIFRGAADVVDLGCGRGEFLAALGSEGITARGVDTNGEMVASARERGLSAVHGDALAYLASLADESVGGLAAIQVIEHLEPSYLIRLLETGARKLRPGAPIVLETINPACWFAFFSSYIRDFTHVRPVHAETLQFLLRASGFERVQIRYSAPVPDQIRMKTADLPASVLSSSEPGAAAIASLAHTVNRNATILNNLMFTHLDYAAVGYRG